MRFFLLIAVFLCAAAIQRDTVWAQGVVPCDPVIASADRSLIPVLVHSLSSGDLGVQGVAISDDGRRVAAGANDSKVRVWERDSGRLLMESTTLGGPLWRVRFTGDSRRILGWGPEGGDIRTHIWDVADGSKLNVRSSSIGAPTAASTFVYGLTSAGANRAGVFDFFGRRPLFTWQPAPYETAEVYAVGANGPVVLSARPGGARFIDRTGERSLSPTPSHFVSDPQFRAMSADGRTAYYSNAVWDVSTGSRLFDIAPDPALGPISWTRFAADGRTLFITYSYHIAVVEARSGRLISRLCGLTNSPPHAISSAAGQLVVANSSDGMGVGVWDALTGMLVAHVAPSHGSIWSADMSRDGTTLVIGTDSGVVQVWRFYRPGERPV